MNFAPETDELRVGIPFAKVQFPADFRTARRRIRGRVDDQRNFILLQRIRKIRNQIATGAEGILSAAPRDSIIDRIRRTVISGVLTDCQIEKSGVPAVEKTGGLLHIEVLDDLVPVPADPVIVVRQAFLLRIQPLFPVVEVIEEAVAAFPQKFRSCRPGVHFFSLS